jgi:transcriptional regulator with XRE-family HTH domain
MNIHEIGAMMVARRKQLRLLQEDLAEMSGVTVKTIYNIEEGKANPSVKTLGKLCEVLGMDIVVKIKMLN